MTVHQSITGPHIDTNNRSHSHSLRSIKYLLYLICIFYLHTHTHTQVKHESSIQRRINHQTCDLLAVKAKVLTTFSILGPVKNDDDTKKQSTLVLPHSKAESTTNAWKHFNIIKNANQCSNKQQGAMFSVDHVGWMFHDTHVASLKAVKINSQFSVN